MQQGRRHPRYRIEGIPSPGKIRQRPQKPPCIRMSGITKNLFRRSDLHDFSGIHDRHTICCRSSHTQVMGHKNRRHAKPAPDLPEQSQNLRLDRHVQRRSRFIRKQNRRIPGKRDRHHAPLPHSARKMMRVEFHPLLRPVYLHQLHQLQHPVMKCFPRDLRVVHLDSLCDLLPNGHGRIQRCHRILENHGK